MEIQKDAGELLIFVYNQYVSDKDVNSQEVIDITGWDSGRINRAIDYLKDLYAIKIHLSLGNTKGVYNFFINGLTPIGIHMVETPEEFKETFGFELNLGMFKFSWQTTKK